MGCRHVRNLSRENNLTDQDESNTKKMTDFKGNNDMQSDSQEIVPKKSTTGWKLVDTSLFRGRKYIATSAEDVRKI